jgi:ribosome-associated translation inhibitor RaiA
MQIQLNTDHTIAGSEKLGAQLDVKVRAALDRFADRITRVEVHLTDVNGRKPVGDDKRCTMEARIAGRQPLSVSHDAPAVALAIDGAAAKMSRALESVFGKRTAARRHGVPAATDEST